MSKPWGSIGDWAADVEREEQEAAAAAAASASSGASGNFPSLRESVTSKPKKKKMTLTEFYTSSAGYAGGESKGLTRDEMLRLPTGPKERSAEEMQYGRLGGGFSNYGRSGSGRMRERDDSEGGWGGNNNNNDNRRQYGRFDEERRAPSVRVSEADEVDNWSIAKKTSITPSYDSSARQNQSSRYSGGGGGGLGGGSRADEVDNWASGGGGGGAGGIREPERPRLVLDPPKGDTGGGNEVVKTNRSNPFGAARPREEVLAEKGLDWKKLEMEIEAKKTSRPTSAHSSRPSSAHSEARSEGLGLQQGLEKPRPKVNPFGDAKPREVLLQERGQDWRKIDLELEHRRVDRPETEEEKLLKEEIEHLKQEAAPKEESLQSHGGDQPSLQEIISQKEKELEQIIRDFDDKVRFGQKAIERPGSGAGRAANLSERPPSQSGSFDESRSMEYMDRPRSRGTQDAWTRPGDERRAFQGGRERGFMGSRDFDR
ncbi:translation initiation factor, putative [Ricinus communis]|uniref:Translation initiation factor, putative n=1 Tax=Ricinus communis TaxID=3988 RepID=B9SVM6_RICCO|nr:translation initiation factor, putative [Ricinus communis]